MDQPLITGIEDIESVYGHFPIFHDSWLLGFYRENDNTSKLIFKVTEYADVLATVIEATIFEPRRLDVSLTNYHIDSLWISKSHNQAFMTFQEQSQGIHSDIRCNQISFAVLDQGKGYENLPYENALLKRKVSYPNLKKSETLNTFPILHEHTRILSAEVFQSESLGLIVESNPNYHFEKTKSDFYRIYLESSSDFRLNTFHHKVSNLQFQDEEIELDKYYHSNHSFIGSPDMEITKLKVIGNLT